MKTKFSDLNLQTDECVNHVYPRNYTLQLCLKYEFMLF